MSLESLVMVMVIVGAIVFVMVVSMPVIVAFAIRAVLIIMLYIIVPTTLHGLLEILWAVGMVVIMRDGPLVK